MDTSAMLRDYILYDDAAAMAEKLGAALECQLLCVDSGFRVIAHCCPNRDELPVFAEAVRRGQLGYELSSLVKSRAASPAIVTMPAASGTELRISELRHRGVLLGFLLYAVSDTLRAASAEQLALTEAILAKQLIFEYHRRSMISNDAEEVLCRLLSGAYEDAAAFQVQANMTYLADLNADRIALISADNERVFSELKAELRRTFYASHPFAYGGQMLLFLNDTHDTALFEPLIERYSLRVVISDEYGELYRLPKAYTNAGLVMEYITLDGRQRLARVCDYHALLLLGRLEDCTELMHPAVTKLLANDRKHGTDYCRTLLAYLLHARSLNATCENLNLHRNTVLYRINKLRDDYGIAFDDAFECFGLTISAAMAVYAQGRSRFAAGWEK